MRSTEVRIGNYYIKRGIIRQVTAEDIVNLCRYEEADKESGMKGAELTDKRILNLGFVSGKAPMYRISYADNDCFYKNGVYLINNNGLYELLIEGSSRVLARLKYVHDLQNAYFALCYEELILKETKEILPDIKIAELLMLMREFDAKYGIKIDFSLLSNGSGCIFDSDDCLIEFDCVKDAIQYLEDCCI
jgi:hypothetical protein